MSETELKVKDASLRTPSRVQSCAFERRSVDDRWGVLEVFPKSARGVLVATRWPMRRQASGKSRLDVRNTSINSALSVVNDKGHAGSALHFDFMDVCFSARTADRFCPSYPA